MISRLTALSAWIAPIVLVIAPLSAAFAQPVSETPPVVGKKPPVKTEATVVGNANNGEALFKRQCAVCHSISDPAVAGVGPNLRKVVGRRAASLPGFTYSASLKASKLTWSAGKLDQFLVAPQTLVKGTMMVTTLPKPEERSDVITYLASLK
jgi:cytochrome c